MPKRSKSTDRARSTGCITTSPLNVSTVYAFVVSGTLVSLKNRRRQFKSRKTGKMFSAKSSDAERYMQDFCRQVPANIRGLKLGSLEEPLRATIRAFYPSRRSDLDVTLLLDCLQVAEVIRNDRDIIEQHLYAEVDALNPRVEIELQQFHKGTD